MAAKAGVSAFGVGLLFAGGILAYSGIKGKGIANGFTSLLQGESPASTPQTTAIEAPAGASFNDVTPTAADPDTAQGTNQGIGQLLASTYGWGSGQNWDDLVSLWNRESGWSNTANNASSGAYGIAQALPATKYPLAGRPPSMGGTSDATTQIQWGLSYIQSRYGNPSAAWAHETANSWY